MKSCWSSLAVLGFSASSLAAALPAPAEASSSSSQMSSNGLLNFNLNTPYTRHLWTLGYDITQDTDMIYPRTGVVREYDFHLTNATCNPDGMKEIECMLINNQYPGPTIKGDWGDTIRITVHNEMNFNGTSLHFHGMQQLGTNEQDGVNGITECPLAPGKTKTYEWHASQHGSSWYHSHHTSQYGAGLLGPVVIRGPTSANYDIDLGPVVLAEWYHEASFTALTRNEIVSIVDKKAPHSIDNILVNGKNTDGQGNGSYSTFEFKQGKKHKMRLINTSVDTAYRFSINGHKFTVVAVDLVPVKPFVLDSLMVGLAQRYDIIVEADQPKNAYWMRVDSEIGCGNPSKHRGYAVVKYANSRASVPSAQEPQDEQYPPTCQAPETKPVWPSNIGSRKHFESKVKTLALSTDMSLVEKNEGDLIFWAFNGVGMDVMWEKPTLTYLAEKNASHPAAAAVYELPEDEEWTYWVVQSRPGLFSEIPHPLHLHGHDFFVLGKGQGSFDAKTAQLNLVDPVRRDTEYLDSVKPGSTGAWLALAFKTGNPGAWLFHCHIAGHISQGLGVQFIDSKSRIPAPSERYQQECSDWNEWYKTAPYKKIDSGL